MLASEFRQFNAHVGCVTETWFNEYMSSSYVDIDGYFLHRRNRKKGKVAAFVFTLKIFCYLAFIIPAVILK